MAVPRAGRPIAAKGLAQKQYLDLVRGNDICFAVGPAGTGKTYLAMALAVRAPLDKQIRRLVLTRPAVEAGERLGFLPGTLEDKVNPYLRPLYDALYDMLDVERAERLLERGTIEVAPIAFMRGRVLTSGTFDGYDPTKSVVNARFRERPLLVGDPASQKGLRDLREMLPSPAGGRSSRP